MATAKSGIPAANAIPKNDYQPKSFDPKQSKYAVEGYSYPSDLMGHAEQYGSNYVIFYINVNEASKMLKNPDAALKDVDFDTNERTKKGLAGKGYSATTVAAAQAGEIMGVGALAKGASNVVSGGGVKAKLFGAITGAVSGAAAASPLAAVAAGGVAAVAVNASGFSRSQKRLKTAIALHVPNQLSIRYGANWGEDETFALQAIIEGGAATGKALVESGKALMSGEGAAAGSAAKTGVKGVSSIVANLALSKGPNAGALSTMSGLAPNPMKEQVFKNVDFRTFSVSYSFAPRNEKEARSVLNIIAAFKYHMHPEYKDANNFLFLYPSEFDVVYYHNGAENMNIHRHTSCVLTELNVDYSPNGNFTTFAGGMPTQINITMSFKELTILTKELIAQGL